MIVKSLIQLFFFAAMNVCFALEQYELLMIIPAVSRTLWTPPQIFILDN